MLRFSRFLFGSMKYTKHHEWVDLFPAEKRARIGITNYAQQQLGEIVYVEMPKIDSRFGQGDQIATIESVKVAAELYTPLTGTVIQVNEYVTNNPTFINEKADQAWIVEVQYNEEPRLQNLMNLEQYKKMLEEQ